LISLGAGALVLFCFLDVLVVLSMLGAVDNVGPILLFGSLASFGIGMFEPTIRSLLVRQDQQ
jgi:hypothetical protein